MSLAEIKQAVTRLPPQEVTALTAYLVELDQAAWNKQIEADSASGKLDFLFEEAEKERAAGIRALLRPQEAVRPGGTF